METDIRHLISQGKNYFKRQAYEKAELIFQKILDSKKEFADVYNMMGVICHQGGEFSKAIDHFEKALAINPHYTEAMLNLSVLYNDLGEYNLSEKLLRASKKKSSVGQTQMAPFVKAKLANKHAEVGDLYRGIGHFERAILEYEAALKLAPHFYDIRNRYAVCLREAGKKKQALNELKNIVKAKKSYLDAYIQLGLTFYSVGEHEKALQIWQKLNKKFSQNDLVAMYLRLTEAALKQKESTLTKKAKTASPKKQKTNSKEKKTKKSKPKAKTALKGASKKAKEKKKKASPKKAKPKKAALVKKTKAKTLKAKPKVTKKSTPKKAKKLKKPVSKKTSKKK